MLNSVIIRSVLGEISRLTLIILMATTPAAFASDLLMESIAFSDEQDALAIVEETQSTEAPDYLYDIDDSLYPENNTCLECNNCTNSLSEISAP